MRFKDKLYKNNQYIKDQYYNKNSYFYSHLKMNIPYQNQY